MDTALQLLARQLCKPAFDLIYPGRRCRCEVNMPMRAARQPGLDLWRLVGGVVVHHEVYVRPLGHLGVDSLEEVEELGGPVPLVTFSDHGAGGDVERGEQGRRAIAYVGMCSAFGHTGCHRQDRLLTIQRLDLGFFVYAQHDRPVWRRHIEANNILHLIDEQRVGRQFERL